MGTAQENGFQEPKKETYQIAAMGTLGTLENLTRTGKDISGALRLIENREAQSPPDPETLETRITRYGWVLVTKANLLTPGGRVPLIREEEDVMQWLPKVQGLRANSVPSHVPAFSGELRVDRIRMLLQKKGLLPIVVGQGAIKVELVERRSKKHLVETEKFPQDTLFYPTGRFATEDGTIIPQSEPEVA